MPIVHGIRVRETMRGSSVSPSGHTSRAEEYSVRNMSAAHGNPRLYSTATLPAWEVCCSFTADSGPCFGPDFPQYWFRSVFGCVLIYSPTSTAPVSVSRWKRPDMLILLRHRCNPTDQGRTLPNSTKRMVQHGAADLTLAPVSVPKGSRPLRVVPVDEE